VFLPFNWGHTAFIYNNEKMADAPTSFDAFLNSDDDIKVVVQDPRSSISGLALMLWMKAVYGDNVDEAFAKLAPKVLTVTKGWSESYGMFTDGEADMVLSYTTSPAYHIIAEVDETKSAAIFDEGHYFMTELVGMVKTTEPEGFKKLALPEKALFYTEDEAAALRDEVLDAWLAAFSQ